MRKAGLSTLDQHDKDANLHCLIFILVSLLRLWPELKRAVYAITPEHPNPPQTLDELEERIRLEFARLSPTKIKSAFASMKRKAHRCIKNDGQRDHKYL